MWALEAEAVQVRVALAAVVRAAVMRAAVTETAAVPETAVAEMVAAEEMALGVMEAEGMVAGAWADAVTAGVETVTAAVETAVKSQARVAVAKVLATAVEQWAAADSAVRSPRSRGRMDSGYTRCQGRRRCNGRWHRCCHSSARSCLNYTC